ncbi:MAG: SDR family NAD(P)-dependent oxidoreductase [Gammaproteobacteria bacterium]|nr:SDR family NAD(P)-dependent oxidoreductase [Gammaproteobacteria bacterium]NNC96677.1 SDR family NAD(P)-dependent oxidoreductase [Gammaproteobacteria bacterium]NNM13227.1 SDR family NAD(P)-dependent oxidoreductase [Gammaproteobacteria bacterium]
MNFNNIRAIVTGGASGLGQGTVKKILAAGGKVCIVDIQDSGKAQADAYGDNAIFVKTDVSNEQQVNAAVDAAVDAFGGIDLAVNCAGIIGAARVLGRDGPMDGNFFHKVLQVNLLGTFLMTKAAANAMQNNEAGTDDERGVIVNTASVAAYEGQIGQAAYSATKAGVVGMTLPIARELARFGIRVMTIAPGIFWTPMMDGMKPEVQESLIAQVPFPKRLGQPDDFADLVKTITENIMLNGETIRLDGAIRMGPK